MFTLKELHSQLDEALNTNTDSTFPKELYTDIINTRRALYLKQEYSKRNRTIDSDIIQTIGCLDFEMAPATDECCSTIQGCQILKSIYKIPETIELNKTKGLISVGPTDITKKRYSIIDYREVPYAGKGRVNSMSRYAFLYNGYLYIFSHDVKVAAIKKLTIDAVFENPEDIADFICDDRPCWSDDSPYPLKQWMWAYIKEEITQELLRKQSIPFDEDPNFKDDKNEKSA